MEEKRCSKCKEVFPRTSEYFYIKSNGKADAMCRVCHRDYIRERYRKQKEGKKINPVGRPRTGRVSNEGTQVCNLCEKEFPLTSEYFCVNKAYETGLTTRCRTCQNAYNREKYAKRKAEGRGREYTPDPKYIELLADRDKRDKEAYRKLVTEPKDKGIGDKLDTLKFKKDKKYRIDRRKSEKGGYEEYLTGEIFQETKELVTFETRSGYYESFRKYDLLCGEYRVKEI